MRLFVVALLTTIPALPADISPTDLDAIITAALEESGAPSVSVSIVSDRKLMYAKAFGMADIGAKRRASPETRYAVGSISKEFTAAALLMLQEEGKLSLDDKVGKYFPEMTRAREITIRQLLNHTAGYEDYAPQDYIIPEWTKPITPQTILNRWGKKPLNFDPGTRWQYSNTNYILAGKIFEKVSGTHLVEFLHTRIFAPLGMTTATDCSEKRPDDAVAYTRYALGPPRVAKREADGWYFAAGELCMTASDLSKWDMGFIDKRLLSAKSYEEFTREVKLPVGKPTRYALGLVVSELDGVPLVWHNGEVSGFLALNEIFHTKGIAVTVLTNEDGINFIVPLGRRLSRAMLQNGEEAPTKEISQIRSILAGLQKGQVERSLFTSNANSYFSELALGDFKSSLQSLGKLKTITRTDENLRGGMTHRTYKADFDKQTVSLNVYIMPDGKVEQFLVEQNVS